MTMPIVYSDIEPNGPEHAGLRLGRVTCSNMEEIISPTGEDSKQADKYINQIIAEKITEESAETFKGNPHTERGKEWEQKAAEYYTMLRGVDLQRVAFVTTDDGLIGCSPDYFIGDEGMLEIKTGLSTVMIDYYLNDKLEQHHRPQTQGGLFVTQRKWIDTMLYNPKMTKQIIIRATRNEPYINTMTGLIDEFHAKMNGRIALLRAKGYMEAA
jgi:hypothetical protein